jgi:hypothetical protein
MTPFDRILEYLTKTWRVDVLILGKGGVLLFLLLYFLFSLVVVKQVRLMSETVTGGVEKELAVAAKGLVGLAVLVFFLALIIL